MFGAAMEKSRKACVLDEKYSRQGHVFEAKLLRMLKNLGY